MKKFCVVLVLLCAAAWAFCMDRPAQDAKMRKNFALNDRGRPVLGESFEAVGNVFAADSGELIFAASESEPALSFSCPLGAWIALDHGEGIVGVYARTAESEGGEAPKRFGKDTVVARAGQSGWASGEGFYFSIFDRRERRWINPAMIAGSPADATAPAIQAVRLRGENGLVVDLETTRSVKQGRYAIEVETSDKMDSAAFPLAPYRIICSINGAEVGVLALETLAARDGVLLLYRNGLAPVRRIYEPYPALEAASDIAFTRGRLSLDVIVQDYNRNTRLLGYRIVVE
jgi:hypothetical protein